MTHHHLHPADIIEYAVALTRGDAAHAKAVRDRAGWHYTECVIAPIRMAIAMVTATCPADHPQHAIALQAVPGARAESMQGMGLVFAALVDGRTAEARALVEQADEHHVAEWCWVAAAGLVAVYNGGGFAPVRRVQVPDYVPDDWTP